MKNNELSYEKSLEKLDDILVRLDNKETTIEQGIELYEQGLSIARDCLAALNESKGKITVLQDKLDRLIETEFQVDDGDL